jgi:hypothetical protein
VTTQDIKATGTGTEDAPRRDEVHDLVWEKDAGSDGVERARSPRYATPLDVYYQLSPTAPGVAGEDTARRLMLVLVYDGGVTHRVPLATYVTAELAKSSAQLCERRRIQPD